MSKKNTGALVALGGIVVLVVSVFAEQIGVGQSGSGFGYKQVTGSAVGILAMLAGLRMMRASSS